MNSCLIERKSCGIHYFVNPTTPSEIYFDQETLQQLTDNECDLSVTGISNYLRNHSSSYSPVLLTWDMTSRCNFNCSFCYIRDNSITREVCFKETVETIDCLVSEGLFEVYLSGGECLLLDDFIKIYRYFKEKGVFITVFTNGSIIDDEILTCWKELPPSSVEITLYNDDYTSEPFCNILKLQEMGLYVLPKFTLTQTTLRYYEGVKQWATDNNLFLAVDSELFDGIDDLHANIEKKYSLSIAQKKYYTPNMYKNIEKPSVIRTGFPCKSKRGIIHISPEFSISLCNKMKTRWDLRNVDIRIALNELRHLIEKYEHAILHGCNGCVYSQRCTMCYVNAEIIDGELYVPNGYCDSLKEKCIQLFKEN